MGCVNVTGASGKASDYVAERHANQPSTEQATQRPAARSAGQGYYRACRGKTLPAGIPTPMPKVLSNML